MKNKSRTFTTHCLSGLLLAGILCILVPGVNQAQEQSLIADGQVHTLQAQEEQYQDFVVPAITGMNQFILEAEGADGGWVEYSYYDRFQTKRTNRINGGEGATVSAGYSIGSPGQQITSGSILRVIIGNRGQLAKFGMLTDGVYGAGGGGGTAVLLSNDGGASWKLLMVAGGGGGAGISVIPNQYETDYYYGHPGSADESGFGGDHIKYAMADGGLHGSGGKFHENTGGGGGAYEDGDHLEGALHYGNAGWKDHELSEPPLGGLGGTQKGCYKGGWGFGGGGGGREGGGGGGGYSGGGGGKNGFGGGGGGSYIDTITAMPNNSSKIQNTNTDNPGDGFVRYKFTKN